MECKVNEGPEKSCSDILGMHIFRGNEGKKEEAEGKMKKRRGGFDQISRDNNLARRRPTERESLPRTPPPVWKQVNDDTDLFRFPLI